MSNDALSGLPYSNETTIETDREPCESNGPVEPLQTDMANTEGKAPSNLEIMNMLKVLKLESDRQRKTLRSLSSDISYIKNEMSRNVKNQNTDADQRQRLANLTFHELQTLCQLLLTTLEVDEDIMPNDEDPDDMFMNIYFHGEEDILSTFYPVDLSLDSKSFKTAEHLYQYKKAEALGQASIGENILAAENGRSAKAIAKRMIKVGPEWDKLKEDVMEDVLQVKAMQCREFRDKLLSTGSRRLIHDLPDSVWGWGRDGFGQNIMGRALERIRSALEDKSSSVFMDDDITQMQNPHGSPPSVGFGEEETAEEQESDHGKALEENHDGSVSQNAENTHNSPSHKKKNRRNRRDGHPQNDENDQDYNCPSGQNHDSYEGHRRNSSGRGKQQRSERSVWSEGSGTGLQVKIPSRNVDDSPEDGPPHNHHRDMGRGRGGGRARGKRGFSHTRNAQEDEAHGSTERHDNERNESREKTQGHVEDDRYVRTRDGPSGYGYKKPWYGERNYNSQYYNSNRGGYHQYRKGRNPRRGRGYRKNQGYDSDSQYNPDQRFNFEGRMYSDHHSEDSSSSHKDRYNTGGGYSGDGQRRSGNYVNQRHQSAGRGSDYHKGQIAGGPTKRGPGVRYSQPQRQVDLENDQCHVTVEVDGQERDREDRDDNNKEGASNNPIGHPESSSHL